MNRFRAWLAAAGAVAGLAAWESRLAGLGLKLGFLGPVGTVIVGLVRALITLVYWVCDGIQVSISRPTVITVELVLLLVGVWQGVGWDKHLAEAAATRLQTVKVELRSLQEADNARAKAAIEAREAAKLQPLAMPAFATSVERDCPEVQPVQQPPPAAARPAVKRITTGSVRKPTGQAYSGPKP